MNYEVCLNGAQVLGGEVGSSDFFKTEAEAVAYARFLLAGVRKGRLLGEWSWACVNVYEGGKVIFAEDA